MSDLEKAQKFAASEELQQVMQDVGVTGEPHIQWMIPRREAVVWDQTLPAMIVTHSVDDFDTWLEHYNAADGIRAEHGIVGHAANQSLDDPSMAIVYHQAESFEALEAFLALPELRDRMQDAGVTSPPEASFATGGFGARYE